jgi:hypothetical protein
MDGPRTARLVETVLRCYPARWRRRHGDEAAELAALLIRDGKPAGSIAWSYLAGAAREWLTPRPGGRLRTVACAMLVAAGSLGVSAGLLASAAPASAASTSQASASQASASQAGTRQASTRQASTPAHCLPGSPGLVPGVLPAMGGHPHVIISGAWHDRSC